MARGRRASTLDGRAGASTLDGRAGASTLDGSIYGMHAAYKYPRLRSLAHTQFSR